MLRTLGSYVGWGTTEASNSQQLDINKTIFNPKDAAHINFIDERLQNFIGKRDALMTFDYWAEAAMAADTTIWLLGIVGPYLAIPGYVAIYFAAKQLGHDRLKQEFDVALDELFAIYQWYTKDQGPAVTHQPRFQELLSAIIPYALDWQKLVVWDLKQLGHNDISPRVAEIFEDSPHKAVAPLMKLDTRPINPAAPTPPILIPNPKTWLTQSNQFQFFTETAANAKLKLLYGHSFENEVREVPQPRKG